MRRLVTNVHDLTEVDVARKVDYILKEYLEFLDILQKGLIKFEEYLRFEIEEHGDDFYLNLSEIGRTIIFEIIVAYRNSLEPEMREKNNNFYVVVENQIRCMELIYNQIDFTISSIEFVTKMLLTGNYTADVSLSRISGGIERTKEHIERLGDIRKVPAGIIEANT